MSEPHIHAQTGAACPCGWIVPTSATPMQLSRPALPGEKEGDRGTVTLPAGVSTEIKAMVLNIPGFAALIRCPECGEQHIVFQEVRFGPKAAST